MPRGTAILLGLAGAAVVAAGIASVRSIAAPVVLSLVLTICAYPVRRALEQRGVPRGLATGVVVTVVFGALAAFVSALVIALAQFATLLPEFSEQIAALGETIGAWLTSIGIGPGQVRAIIEGFDPARLVDVVAGLFGGVTSLTASLVVVLTTLILMAVDASYLRAIFAELRPQRPRVVTSLESLASGIRRYMVATTVLGIAQGGLNAIALALLGVPGALLWGLLAFLCSFIPNVGYFIAIIPPVVFGFLVGGWQVGVPVIVVYAVINAVVQTGIQPRVVGNAVALSQTITFVSVLFWALILGPIGAVLAIPLTLMVRFLLIDTDPTAGWWRPVIGDLTRTKVLMSQLDAERKAERRAKKSRSADER
ncbi:putative PurR-regulated permease PerM [Conyzicola lurida]|uniref:Putative PurR-regulated permease PerM n=1 Tax=Conyzicola lurida TaxID=1172621 RepID=A0A841AP46_9MICO|nr:AI-2E family transporter [Conyzicola lurida]MBB5843466.1 putative PurR-regulated permease PerM [Conyzicola lurida]